MSIKNQLVSLIIATVILASFLAALHGYRNSLNRLDEVFDQELITVANLIADVANHSDFLPAEIDSSLAFQVIQDGNTVAKSKNAPSSPIKFNSMGFSESTFFGRRWRTFTVQKTELTIVVAQPIAFRTESAESILLVTISPIVYAIPIIALLIFYIVNKSLKGLTDLSLQLRQRSYDDLSKIHLRKPADELIPVINRMNHLLGRLDEAFTREKQLTANATHELRTPISVLSLTAHNIKQEFENNNLTPALLNELEQNIDRLAHVIEQMIALYRFTPEQFNGELQQLDVHSILQDVISNNFDYIDANSQVIELNGEPSFVRGDVFALTTLFENIVRNSIKYSGHGAQIKVSTLSKHGNVLITIEDSGEGLVDKELEKIFERFYRVQNNLTRVKGCGLGLSIAKHIVSIHNGVITCSKSDLGGLCTRISLPAEKTSGMKEPEYGQE